MSGKSTVTINCGYVEPNQSSAQQLSGGVYSLSARSNVPFVKLIGKGMDKTFTWGDVVEVPKGQIATIVNASYHAGDLFINSGCDLGKPSRITVPVPCVLATSGLFNGNWVPDFPADVRTARRAYMAFDAETIDLSSVIVIGTRLDGSHNTQDELVGSTLTGSGYISITDYAAFTTLGLIPLGHLAMIGDVTPHALLTTAYAVVPGDVELYIGSLPNAYYVMEY